LIAEHNLITGMLDYPDSGIDHTLGLLHAHDRATKTLGA
jgi:hypothetical protein